jgi:preprotein translocase subunit SecE
MGFGQYLKDTRGELRHVAWPTRLQTVVYTALVVILSVLVALYLGFFDFLFTSGLGKVVEMLPASAPFEIEQPEIDFTTLATTTPPTNQ